MRDTPLLRRWWSDGLADRAERLWAERHALLDLLDRLPQTLVHGDADRRNFFARRAPTGRDETVAIDWAYAGVAAVGEDLVNLVVASALWFRATVAVCPRSPSGAWRATRRVWWTLTGGRPAHGGGSLHGGSGAALWPARPDALRRAGCGGASGLDPSVVRPFDACQEQWAEMFRFAVDRLDATRANFAEL